MLQNNTHNCSFNCSECKASNIFFKNNIEKYLSNIHEEKKRNMSDLLYIYGINNIIKKNDKKKMFIQPLFIQKLDTSIKIVSRPDFVGQYVGHTCEKTRRLLSDTLKQGKVLFVDEAYSIVSDEQDSFGHEALNELNRFMSEYPQLVVIFAGYKDKIEETLFKYQPGFKRRCTWIFEITNYSGSMLAQIFKKQLAKEEWYFDGNDDDLVNFFEYNFDNFESFGGDTLRLGFYCKLKYSEIQIDCCLINKQKSITIEILNSAYNEMYCSKSKEPSYLSKFMMYS